MTVGEVDHRLAQRHIDLVGPAVGDEFAVELELDKGHFAKPRQGRIAAAEFVDGEPHIVRCQPLAEVDCQREVGNDVFLAQANDQGRPLIRARAMRLHDVGDRQLVQDRGMNI
jgi:hypothetical protein